MYVVLGIGVICTFCLAALVAGTPWVASGHSPPRDLGAIAEPLPPLLGTKLAESQTTHGWNLTRTKRDRCE